MANKIKYGLSNVKVFPISATSEAGAPTYGNAIPVPGAVSLTLDPAGNETSFYADNVVYFSAYANNGYTGAIEFAHIPDEFKTGVLGWTTDANGVVVEAAGTLGKEFAMTYQFEGDATDTKFVLYRCTAQRPAGGSSTQTETITPQTESFTFTAMPRIDNKNIKAYAEAGTAAYATFDTAPYVVGSTIAT